MTATRTDQPSEAMGATGREPTGTPREPRQSPHPLDAFVPDPSGLPPLCGEEQFASMMEGLVADAAPRMFAIVQEYGDRVDGHIAGWGMAFDDHVEAVSMDGQLRMRLHTLEKVLHGFDVGTHIHARVVWFNPDAATPADDHDAA